MPGEEKELEEITLALSEIGVTYDGKKSVAPSVLNAREDLITALHKLAQSGDID